MNLRNHAMCQSLCLREGCVWKMFIHNQVNPDKHLSSGDGKPEQSPTWQRIYHKISSIGKGKCEVLLGTLFPSSLSLIFFSILSLCDWVHFSHLCVLSLWIALPSPNVSWFGVQRGIVCCCQSSRLQQGEDPYCSPSKNKHISPNFCQPDLSEHVGFFGSCGT